MAFVKKLLRALRKIFKSRPSRRKKSRLRPRVRRKKVVRRLAKSVRRTAVRSPSKRSTVRKRLGKRPLSKPKSNSVRPLNSPLPLAETSPGILIGDITHYFSKIMVCVVKVSGASILIGDKIIVCGTNTRFRQRVKSLQVQSVDVKIARRGELVGLKVDQNCRVGDLVYQDR